MPIKYHTTRLANGLTLLGESNPANVSSAIGFFVKTGSRDETAAESGLSHFLEHMLFKGTPTRNALQINLELGNLGAQANAFTSEENTVYYAAVIPERFSEMQELLSDMMRPSLDPDEFDMEKKVILEEIALYQDRPHFYLFENAYQSYFKGHTAGNSVLGSHQSVSALTNKQMRDYFQRRYSPSNIALVATGNFSWESFVDAAQRYCGDWRDHTATRELSPHRVERPDSVVFKREKLNQAHAILITEGASAQQLDRYPLAVLATIMGDSTGSRMFWELVNSGLAESASVDSDDRDGTGCVSAYLSCRPSDLDMVLEKARAILATPLEFSEQDLDRAKAKLLARIALDGELPMGRLMALGLEWNYRRESTPLSTVIERVKAISKQDIAEALNRYPLRDWSEYKLIPA
ncbi:MAG: M16 family metallopeptidase [Pseudomonadota bacterium]